MTARKMTTIVLTLTLVAVGSIAIAQGRHGGQGGGAGDDAGDGPGGLFAHGRGHGGFGQGMLLGRLADKLDLSDEQRLEIAAIYEACREGASDLRDQLQTARDEHAANHELGVFDETEARVFAETITGIQAELMIDHMRANSEAFNVLTPEQQDELRDLLDNFSDFFGPRHKGRHGTGRG